MKRGPRIIRGCGTVAAYNRGCRCDKCRVANSAYRLAQAYERASRRERSTFKHGASAYTNWHCRCDTCSIEHSKKMKRDRARRKRKRAEQQKAKGAIISDHRPA